MNLKSKPLILVSIIAAVIIIAGVGFWYWSKNKQSSRSEEASSLGGQIFDKTQNPLEGQVPDANPFKNQKNPLDSIYQNPFE
ncbi:MAG: hypothetical protein A2942_00815 [Candidatus Lloydbacteria bacterium RIFCSPLOWO2_01_FULL_50_20]|uniref:Uncharacterized protein n=1 Tax=Candidatus Lloydbacteria bacterium RIFCSPLOWO2_01_FULL_50_20 TaxID=1798665 RepID=A0A1G2DEA3_9BACT|nr:MAG: hypothetical protein A3C13_04810 [Candidatus Lloydbacteria bacterium RIFCSPHIGHO2_02_FULL_50_11]OGZ11108.1 MAG: hypothetical protein A2942_00815 [Candidatus Lloydbacteria bacterium RIFCSPLOWO2_01_FULL_50_20]